MWCRFASSDLYRSKEIQLAKSHSLMIFMRTRHLNSPRYLRTWQVAATTCFKLLQRSCSSTGASRLLQSAATSLRPPVKANFFFGPTFDLEIYRTRVKGHLKHFNPKATQKVCGIAVPPAFIEKSFLVWFKASTASGYGTARGKKTLLCIRIHVNVL